MSDEKPQDSDGAEGEGISDDQLPPDVQPSEDNPLARHPEQTGDADDEIGSDREGDPETAPLTEEDADYSDESSSDSGSDS